MPVTIEPADTTPPDELRIRALTIRVTNGVERDAGGVPIRDGRITVVTQLGVYRGGVWLCDLDAVTVPDVEAWVSGLAGAGDIQAAEVADKFGTVNDGLKWLCAKAAAGVGQSIPPA